jgi:hypothetical protein
VGGAFELSDEVLRRLRQTALGEPTTTEPVAPESGVAVVEATETEADHVRYALLGMLLDGEALAYYSSLVTWELARSATHGLTAAFDPLMRFRAARRGRRQVQALADHGAELVARWRGIGRTAEPQGRAAALQVAESILDDILAHLAHDPEMRELIEHQGLGLAGSVVGEMRERTISADSRVERIVRGLLHRQATDASTQEPATTPRPLTIQPAAE